MRKRILVLLTVAILLLCAGVAAAEQKGTVHGGWLQMRSIPSFAGKVLASYPSGTVVTVNAQSGSWYAVTAPDGLQGYMLSNYLRVSGAHSVIPAGSTAYVTSSNGLNVRMRTGPGLNYGVIASYAPGTVCTIQSAESGWYQIRIGSYTGYMMARYLTEVKPSGSSTTKPDTDWTYGDNVWVTSTNGKGVYLREGPGKNYASIGFYAVGTAGRALKYGSTWTYVQIGDRTGYMMTRFLTSLKPAPMPTAPAVVPPASGAWVISGNGRNVNLRSGPGIQYNAIAAFAPGTQVTILTQGIEWNYVQIQGFYGYMMRKYIYDSGTAPASISNEM